MPRRRPVVPFLIVARPARRRRRGSVRRNPTISDRKKAYLAYINSPAWRAFRTAWWAEHDKRNQERRCYCCNTTEQAAGRFDLHHRTYERLGHEHYDDLVPVCRSCHTWITRQWRARARTGLTMTLWELTEERRHRSRKRGAGGT